MALVWELQPREFPKQCAERVRAALGKSHLVEKLGLRRLAISGYSIRAQRRDPASPSLRRDHGFDWRRKGIPWPQHRAP
jgi:hypothetical protein